MLEQYPEEKSTIEQYNKMKAACDKIAKEIFYKLLSKESGPLMVKESIKEALDLYVNRDHYKNKMNLNGVNGFKSIAANVSSFYKSTKSSSRLSKIDLNSIDEENYMQILHKLLSTETHGKINNKSLKGNIITRLFSRCVNESEFLAALSELGNRERLGFVYNSLMEHLSIHIISSMAKISSY